jgi:hypothetical protein
MDKWEKLGYMAAIFNSIPTGLIAGYFLYKERRYKRTGRNVIIISILLTALVLSVIFIVKHSIQVLNTALCFTDADCPQPRCPGMKSVCKFGKCIIVDMITNLPTRCV